MWGSIGLCTLAIKGMEHSCGGLWGSIGLLAINGMEHSCGGLLGDSGRVANSLDFCPASLKSLGCFYFQCVLSSQRKAVTVNL